MKAALIIWILITSVLLAPIALGMKLKEQPSRDVEQIMQLHKALLDAHKAGDVEELIAAESDEIVRVSQGEVLFPQRSERMRRFTRYLQITEFEVYRDLIDPIVHVSADGSLGWLIAQVEISGTQNNGNDERVRIDSVWAWIELYEKKDGRWYRVGDVSTVRSRDKE